MFHEPKTLKEARAFRYGRWAGEPKGREYKEGKCAAEILGGWNFYQCPFKNGKGPAGLYCGIHAKKVVDAEATMKDGKSK